MKVQQIKWNKFKNAVNAKIYAFNERSYDEGKIGNISIGIVKKVINSIADLSNGHAGITLSINNIVSHATKAGVTIGDEIVWDYIFLTLKEEKLIKLHNIETTIELLKK